MPIVVNLDVMMARRHKGAGELAEEIGITPANLSDPEEQQGQGRAVFDAGGALPGAGLPAGGYSGVCAGRESVGAGHARPAAYPQTPT